MTHEVPSPDDVFKEIWGGHSDRDKCKVLSERETRSMSRLSWSRSADVLREYLDMIKTASIPLVTFRNGDRFDPNNFNEKTILEVGFNASEKDDDVLKLLGIVHGSKNEHEIDLFYHLPANSHLVYADRAEMEKYLSSPVFSTSYLPFSIVEGPINTGETTVHNKFRVKGFTYNYYYRVDFVKVLANGAGKEVRQRLPTGVGRFARKKA